VGTAARVALLSADETPDGVVLGDLVHVDARVPVVTR